MDLNEKVAFKEIKDNILGHSNLEFTKLWSQHIYLICFLNSKVSMLNSIANDFNDSSTLFAQNKIGIEVFPINKLLLH